MTYLELAGYLEAGTATYSSYRFRPLETSVDILARFHGERQQFLSKLFRQAKKARVWFDIDLEGASRALDAPRSRLVGALDYLAEQQLMELKVGGVRHRYQWLRRFEDAGAVAAELHAKALDHERREIERLDLMLELAAHDGCQTGFLCEYFGQTLTEPCGHCGWCLDGGKAAELASVEETDIDEEVWRRALELRSENREVLAEARAFSRFLAGLRSPRISRARLGAHPPVRSPGDRPFPRHPRTGTGPRRLRTWYVQPSPLHF